MARLIGLDIGTSGAKALAVNEKGEILASASSEYPLSTPHPGWAEQNPEDWWTAAQKCLSEVGAEGSDAIGLTGQMHGSVFLDGKGDPIRPALLWCDQRTQAECKEIEARIGPQRVRAITGNPPLTGFQLPKLLWLKNNEPDSFKKLHKVLLPKDYIRFKLTGEDATDVSDASGVGCLDVTRRAWSEEIMNQLGIQPNWMPQVRESMISGADWKGIPVAAGAGDQAAAAMGTGTVSEGIISVSLGTSGVVFAATRELNQNHTDSIHDFCHSNQEWHRMGVMLSCGGSIRWARDLFFAGESDYSLMNDLAESAGVGASNLMFAPYLSGERCPYVDPNVKGGFVGIALHHDRSHFARAVFEGVSFGLRECLDLITNGTPPAEIRLNGGGVKSRLWVQMLADIFQTPCSLMEIDEGPAFGAALLGGLSAGVWASSQEAAKAAVRVKSVVNPSSQDYSILLERYRRIYPLMRSWSLPA